MNDFKKTLKKLLKYIDINSNRKIAIKTMIVAGLFTIIVRIFGFLKESIIANYFGVSKYVDFYLLSLVFATFFVIPIGGSLGVLLTKSYIKLNDKISQISAANIYVKCQFLGVILISFLGLIQAGLLTYKPVQIWIENRFDGLSETHALFLLPICLFCSISIINRSILAAREKFTTHALLPIFVPITILIFLLISPQQYLFEALFLGTVFGFFFEFVIGGIFLKQVILDINFKKNDNQTNELKKIINSAPSMFLSSIIMSGCLIVDQIMSVLAGDGALAMINYGNRVPLGVISIIAIVWTVLYPSFIKDASENNFTALKKNISYYCMLSLLLLFPFLGIFSLFSQDVITFLFQRGAFVSSDTLIVSDIQTLYLLHIPLYVISMICVRVLNTLEKTNIILLGNILLLILNIAFNLYFIEEYGVIGVPLATLVSYSIIAILWFISTHKQIKTIIK
ncbi:polysaccharide biosynthesis C-terminal domain-containing protein [Alphaproteobacteria bacterium]|nr:polysaccharide biosynthesis C-terminal domain-containing protein [Alphaproteobacteria bacterium]